MKELLLLFFVHFIADFTPLSTKWMLSAKRIGYPYFPIFCHAFIHSLLVYGVLLLFTNNAQLLVLLSAFELVTHFVIDVLKGKLNVLYPSINTPANKIHWVVFGADQYLHAVVIIIISTFI